MINPTAEKGKMDIPYFLIKLIDVQSEEKNRTLPVVQIIILYELWKSDTSVLLSDIQNKYNLERYIVSRNCMMLSHDRIKDNKKIRQGKGWIIKNHISDKYDGRMKEAKLTAQGEKIAERLFGA